MTSQCLKCGNKKPMVTSQSLPGEGLYIFVRCTCGTVGPKVRPGAYEAMIDIEKRAIRMWNRENIKSAPGAVSDGDCE